MRKTQPHLLQEGFHLNHTPLVSILLNVYNGSDYLAACIQSVLDQSYQNFEFIIADDASDDGTLEIIRSFSDPRIRCITRTRRRHIPYTINEALALAKGEWIAHIDHDDLWERDKLQKQMDYVLSHPGVGVCFCQINLIDHENQIINDQFPGIYQMFNTSCASQKEWVRRFFYEGNCLSYPSSLIRRDLMPKQNLFCRQAHDFEMWCRLIPKTDFYVYPEALVRQRWVLSEGKSSLSSPANDNRLENEMLLVVKPLLLNGLSDRQLIDFFGEDFRCSDSSTPLELKIERAFLLEKCGLTDSPTTPAGLCAFEEILRLEGGLSLLEDKYGFDLPAFYQRTGSHVLYTRVAMRNTQTWARTARELEAAQAQAAGLESALAARSAELEEWRNQAQRLQAQQARAEEALASTREELDTYRRHYTDAITQRDGYLGRIHQLQGDIAALRGSFSWRVTAPLRAVTGGLRRLVHKMPHVLLVCKGLRFALTHGPRATLRQVRRYRAKVAHRKAELAWERRWRAENGALVPPPEFGCLQETYEAQQNQVFPRPVKFSILVPLYNTPEQFLREMIASVQHQTYSNWELCLADGSDAGHPEVERICRELAAADRRIQYQKLERNLGISGNTNACIDMATGDYIALFDHDDLLHPCALYEDMRAICEQGADFIYTDENTFHDTPRDAYCPHFKPDFAPDTLRANNYICHFTVFSRALLDKVGRFRPECDGSQDFDMVLRLTEQARKIVHIPKILYYWRASAASVASDVSAKPYVIEAAHRAVSDHLKRVGLKGRVLDSAVPSMYRLSYEIPSEDLVSIIICSKDHIDDLKQCVDSILAKTTYPNYEIIVVENNSTQPETFAYYQTLAAHPRIRVVTWETPVHEFNYSAVNNFGFTCAKGKYILLLNNDTEIITSDWLQEMVMYAQREDVGAVGAKLYYPDETVQHAGIGIGLLTLAGHYHRNFPRSHPGYMGRLIYAQDVSAVTAACIMLRRDVWEQVGGLDETFKVAFNDVDLCMRVRQAGYLIVWTPFAELYHYESKSRGTDEAPEKRARFVGEVERFQARWAKELAAGDPYYNPNFSLDREDFTVRDDILLQG